MKCQAFVEAKTYRQPGQCEISFGVKEVSWKGKKIRGLCSHHKKLLVLNRLNLTDRRASNLEPARGINVRHKKISSLSKV